MKFEFDFILGVNVKKPLTGLFMRGKGVGGGRRGGGRLSEILPLVLRR
jgi:hypothetical protein